MDVVMSICDQVSVLDFGQKIPEGKPAEVQADEKLSTPISAELLHKCLCIPDGQAHDGVIRRS